MTTSRVSGTGYEEWRDYRPLHLSIPVFPFGTGRSENFEVPLAAAPRLYHLSRNDVHEDLGEGPPFGIPFEVVGRLVPRERGVEHHRQKQVVSIVDHDELTAGTLHRGVVDEIFLSAVRPDVALEREFAGDDLFDGDLLVPAVAAVPLLTARFGHVLRAAQRAPRLYYGFPGHGSILLRALRLARADRRAVHLVGVLLDHAACAASTASFSVECAFPSISQPFCPVYPSAHHPSPILRCGTPLIDAFMPLVPLASSGLRGLFIHTSHPCTRKCATWRS